MKIEINPAGDKRTFKIPLTISSKTVAYPDSQSAALSPIANKLFGFPWTQSVVVGPDFIEVSKQDWIDWSALEEPLSGLIAEHFEDAEQSGKAIEENRAPAVSDLKSPMAQQIQAVLDEEINPAVAAHGGFIRLIEVKDNEAYIHMGGGCQGCGMKDVTLKQGVVSSLQARVPALKAVHDVTDHAEGQTPYYQG